ncbi:MAG TPA: hypothetical protein VK745_33070 [Polyangiaceae bacterium]|nr:hypothetical protein [Polyangiaceae bacterium]
MTRASALLFCVLSAALLLPPAAARAETDEQTASTTGRPRVKLDRLSFPADLAGAKEFEGHLRSTLKHEARRADWGAGSSSKISYRFFVEQLELREEAGVLHVSCTALGRLPKGRSAKSHIVFGGDPHDRKKVVERVLDIVARGVVTRLAELERARRTP